MRPPPRRIVGHCLNDLDFIILAGVDWGQMAFTIELPGNELCLPGLSRYAINHCAKHCPNDGIGATILKHNGIYWTYKKGITYLTFALPHLVLATKQKRFSNVLANIESQRELWFSQHELKTFKSEHHRSFV